MPEKSHSSLQTELDNLLSVAGNLRSLTYNTKCNLTFSAPLIIGGDARYKPVKAVPEMEVARAHHAHLIEST